MGRNSKIAIAALSALAIASCSQSGEQSTNPTPTETPAPTDKAVTQPFNNPVVPNKQAPLATSKASDLIQPTNATERAKIVLKGRNDPFAQILGQYPVGEQYPIREGNNPNNTVNGGLRPVPQYNPNNTVNGGLRPVPQLPPLPNVNNRGALRAAKAQRRSAVLSARTNNRSNTAKNTTTPKQVSIKPSVRQVMPKVLPQVVSSPNLAPVVPPPPQPELARGVFVSGIVLIGQQPSAIIKVPNEPTSRYVQAGQRLANGVVIKRIEMNEGSEPIVILEQFGIEVAKMVGEAPGNGTQTPVDATGNQVSMTPLFENPISHGAT
jgi:hypothetical protein